MELAVLRSLVSDRCSGRIGLPAVSRPPRFRGTSRPLRSPSPAPCEAGSSSRERSSPSEFSSPHPPAASRLRAPSLGFLPLRDISRWSPRSRASQARFVPPSGFLTPSTASSTTGLAGLFHPAATSGIRPSGFSPPAQPRHLVDGRCPRVVRPRPLPPTFADGATAAAPPSGPCSAPESVVSRKGLACAPPAPLLGFTSSGCSVRSPCHRFRGSSARDLGCRAVQARPRIRPSAFPWRAARHASLEARRPARGSWPANRPPK